MDSSSSVASIDSPTPIPEGNCDLLGFFGVIVQLMLAVVSISALLLKKFLPGERRSWKVFGMDTVKQMSSMLFAHFMNVVLAIQLHNISGHGSGCVWYLMNYLCDFFIGMTLSLILLRLINLLAVRNNYEYLRSGHYSAQSDNRTDHNDDDQDERVDYWAWFLQILLWTLCVAIAKLTLFGVELQLFEPLLDVGDSIITWTGLDENPRAQLVFVMILVPTVFNSMQYWIQDHFLKSDKHFTSQNEESKDFASQKFTSELEDPPSDCDQLLPSQDKNTNQISSNQQTQDEIFSPNHPYRVGNIQDVNENLLPEEVSRMSNSR